MNLQRFIDTALDILDEMRRRELLDESRTGGYMTVLSIFDRPINVPLLVAQIGDLTGEKIIKYYTFSLEKAARLARTCLGGHQSSWQSRDPDNDQWGGAIRANAHILSFSGLPELADEALMLSVALERGMLSREQVDRIADISDNEIFRQLIAT